MADKSNQSPKKQISERQVDTLNDLLAWLDPEVRDKIIKQVTTWCDKQIDIATYSLKSSAQMFDDIIASPSFISFYTGENGTGSALRQTLRIDRKHFDPILERMADKKAKELGACSWWVYKAIGMPISVYYGNRFDNESSRLEYLDKLTDVVATDSKPSKKPL